MKGDFSRFTFDRARHYSGVRLQQGRVQLDADWNEHADIAAHLRHTLAADLIGASGAPEIGGGFAVDVSGGTPRISAGRYYVDGLLCENEETVPLTGQPDLPGYALPAEQGVYLAYVDAWERSVTALEDPGILELALGGPDTATRTRTVWQVRLWKIPGNPPDPIQFPLGWQPDPQPTPLLGARALGAPRENQLYRVEIHDPGKPGVSGGATFKWSRENGSVAASIENPATTSKTNLFQLVIQRQIGPDQAGGFQIGEWIEITDETRILNGQPGIFAKLSSVVGQVLRVEGWPGPTDPIPDLPASPLIRRWDSEQAALVPADSSYVSLDGAVEIRFDVPGYDPGDPGHRPFRTGDFWLIPTRAAAGVLWPEGPSGEPAWRPPHGVRHHYAPLAVLSFSGAAWSVRTDSPQRKVFRGTTVIPGPEKLNRTENDTMTASLRITGNLTVEKEVTVGRDNASGGKLTLLRAPLVLATGDATERGLRFPPLGGAGAFLRYDNAGGVPRLALAAEAPAALALRQGTADRITLANGRVGIHATNPQQDVHVKGDVILLDPGTRVTIQKAITYNDGHQAAGRVLTSDAQGNATWQDLPKSTPGIPVFTRMGVDHGVGTKDWTVFDKVPANASAVILEAYGAMVGPDGEVDEQTASILIRKRNGDPEYLLLSGASAGSGDKVAWAGQGIFPVADGRFEYTVDGPGFGARWGINLVGYFPAGVA